MASPSTVTRDALEAGELELIPIEQHRQADSEHTQHEDEDWSGSQTRGTAPPSDLNRELPLPQNADKAPLGDDRPASPPTTTSGEFHATEPTPIISPTAENQETSLSSSLVNVLETISRLEAIASELNPRLALLGDAMAIASRLENVATQLSAQQTTSHPPEHRLIIFRRYHDYTSEEPAYEMKIHIPEGRPLPISALAPVYWKNRFIMKNGEVADIPDPLPWDFIMSNTAGGVNYLETFENPAPPLYIWCRVLSLLVLRGGVIACLVLGATMAAKDAWSAILYVVIGGFVQDIFQAVLDARIIPGRPFNFAPSFF